MAQVTVEKSSSKSRTEEEAMTDAELKTAQEAGKAAMNDFDVDEILNDIDDVLEENAEVFVADFIQRGGQ